MKTLKVGAVGLGRLGRQHAENLAAKIPNAQLVAVCSIVEAEVEQFQKEWGTPYTYLKFDDMLANPEIEAVCISSSSTEHCRQIEAALAAGKHVFCEKPLGVNLEEITRTEENVKKYGHLVFQLGFMRRYDASYAYAKQKLQDGAIGQPVLIRCYGLDPVSAVQGAIAFAEKSGGLFLDMAIHDIDLARWFLDSEAQSVYAIGGCYAYPEFARFNDFDNGSALLQFGNGAMAFLYAGRTCAHGYHIETEIVGTAGTLRIGTVPQKNLVTVSNENGVIQECVGGFLERFADAYLQEMQHFVNCVLHGGTPLAGVEDGVKSTQIAYAANKSLEQRQVVYL